MKLFIIIAIVVIVGGIISISDRLTEIEVNQRVIKAMLDDLKQK